MRLIPLLTIFTGAMLAASCSQPAPHSGNAPPPDTTTLNGRMAGHWIGKVNVKPDAGEGQKDFLSEQLGGYSLDLKTNGRFESNWRGLSKEGTWVSEKGTVELRPEKVLGKTKAESGADQPLFDKDNRLTISTDEQRLVLPANGKDSEAVEFSKSSR